MHKPNSHPMHNQLSSAFTDFFKPGQVSFFGRFAQMWEMMPNSVISEFTQIVDITTGIEQFVIADPQKCWCHTTDNGAWFGLWATIIKHIANHIFASGDQT